MPLREPGGTGKMVPITTAESSRQHAGKYLIFLLGKEEFGITVLKIREIVPMQEIVAVPQAPAYIRGLINLRGSAIAVMDLRHRFGLRHIEDTERTCIVVADVEKNLGKLRIGLVVDGVAEVQSLAANDIEPPPGFGTVTAAPYLLRMANGKGKIRLLVDIEQVLGRAERETLAAAIE